MLRISKSLASGAYRRRGLPCLQKSAFMRLLSSAPTPTPPDDDDATSDYFSVLGVDRSFTLSSDELKSKYKRLMTEFHPDRHASSSIEEKSYNASLAAKVTRAYGVIENPLSRALHLLELNGAAIEESDSAIVDGSLLMEVMEIREAIEDASTDEELRPILKLCQEKQSELCAELAGAFREERIDDAKALAAKLQYWNRIEETIMEKISEVA
ncbi:hypothetical protein ACHAXT_007043 [Thalassiosira profunda]